jgi:hypothetical protein
LHLGPDVPVIDLADLRYGRIRKRRQVGGVDFAHGKFACEWFDLKPAGLSCTEF